MRRADLNGYANEFVECFRAIQYMKEKGIEIEILSKNDPMLYCYGSDVLFGMIFFLQGKS